MVVDLSVGHWHHDVASGVCLLGSVALLAIGGVGLQTQLSREVCGPEDHRVSVGAFEASNADATMLAFGIPTLISGLLLLMWGLRAPLWKLRMLKDQSSLPGPFLQPSAWIFVLAALCLWFAVAASLLTDAGFQTLCSEHRCGSLWASGASSPDMECLGTDAALQDVCGLGTASGQYPLSVSRPRSKLAESSS